MSAPGNITSRESAENRDLFSLSYDDFWHRKWTGWQVTKPAWYNNHIIVAAAEAKVQVVIFPWHLAGLQALSPADPRAPPPSLKCFQARPRAPGKDTSSALDFPRFSREVTANPASRKRRRPGAERRRAAVFCRRLLPRHPLSRTVTARRGPGSPRPCPAWITSLIPPPSSGPRVHCYPNWPGSLTITDREPTRSYRLKCFNISKRIVFQVFQINYICWIRQNLQCIMYVWKTS